MDLSGFRSESHVAQQSRRHKLRVQQDYPNNLEGVPQDLIQASNLGFGNTLPYSHPAVFPSEMLNFGDNPQPILAQELPAAGQSGRTVPDGSGGYPRASGEPTNCGIWRAVNLEQNFSYSSGLQGNESNRFVNNVSASGLYLKSGYNGYQDVVVTSTHSEVSSSKHHYGEMQFGSSSVYHPHVSIPTASAATSGGNRGCWTESGNELVLLPPTYGGQPNPAWPDELGLLASKSGDRDQLRTVGRDCSTQSLSLSLCPVLPSKTNVGQFGADSMTGSGSKVLGDGNGCQVMMGSSTFANRNTGPLGPFTGYATILKCSKFLKPAQQLLEEICSLNAPKPVNAYESPDKDSVGNTSLREAIRAADSGGEGKGGGDSGVSSSVAYGSNEISGDVGGRSSSGPEYQQKKAKLLFMQEEVCRRYKQYHQQMEMVVSSFESVAGLSAATPYISLALKTISRHFRCLKNAILDQLKHIRNALGEDFLSPTGASSSKGEHSNTSRLKFIEHGFNTPKSSGGNLGFFEPQQHVWRPQRGLPERAVSVLRAWLFEHFLHPYPTDTDKHMLAAQTGLSRNQVSNWFINARVRVWKPMVEEIHMLETTGLAESNPNEPKTPPENANPLSDCHPKNKYSATAMSSNASLVGRGEEDGQNAEEWNQEKRSRVECQIPDTMDGSLLGFMPYQRSGLEMGGLGAVSLTLGLRQSPDGTQQQQQLQQQEHQLRQHFGGQMIHDFVG